MLLMSVETTEKCLVLCGIKPYCDDNENVIAKLFFCFLKYKLIKMPLNQCPCSKFYKSIGHKALKWWSHWSTCIIVCFIMNLFSENFFFHYWFASQKDRIKHSL